MLKSGRVCGLICCLLLGLGCATTKMTSSREASYEGKPFHKLFIMASIAEPDLRTSVEQAFVDRLALRKVEAVPSFRVLVPNRQYSEQELSDILAKYNIEGVLLITLTDQYKQRVAATSPADCSSAMVSANSAMLSAPTCNIQGYAMRPTVEFRLRLYNVDTNMTAWEGSSITQGITLTHFDVLAKSLADKTVSDIANEGLIF